MKSPYLTQLPTPFSDALGSLAPDSLQRLQDSWLMRSSVGMPTHTTKAQLIESLNATHIQARPDVKDTLQEPQSSSAAADETHRSSARMPGPTHGVEGTTHADGGHREHSVLWMPGEQRHPFTAGFADIVDMFQEYIRPSTGLPIAKRVNIGLTDINTMFPDVMGMLTPSVLIFISPILVDSVLIPFALMARCDGIMPQLSAFGLSH